MVNINDECLAVGIGNSGSYRPAIIKTGLYLGMFNWWHYLDAILNEWICLMSASCTKTHESKKKYSFHIAA